MIYPKGFVSIVSDTWDFWQVMTDYLPRLKDTIMARDGRVVIRPDSGDPVDIICGVSDNDIAVSNGKEYYIKGITESDIVTRELTYMELNNHPEDNTQYILEPYQRKGAYEIMWDIFGGTVNEKGYKVLDSHIGLLYGDSITLERQKEIYKRLEAKGFAATNLVLGVGSYTYQYKSRDSLGFAVKATACKINGELVEIFKQPKTDDGTKNSLKGLIKVVESTSLEPTHKTSYVAIDQVSEEEEMAGALEPVFVNGELMRDHTLKEIRERINSTL